MCASKFPPAVRRGPVLLSYATTSVPEIEIKSLGLTRFNLAFFSSIYCNELGKALKKNMKNKKCKTNNCRSFYQMTVEQTHLDKQPWSLQP